MSQAALQHSGPGEGRGDSPPPIPHASSLGSLLALIAASVFVVEAFVTFLLMVVPPVPYTVSTLLDATLVTLLMAPVLYRYVVRPMAQHIDELRQAEAALSEAYAEMESRVRDRTAELAQANAALQVEVAAHRRASEDLKVALDASQQREAEIAGLLKSVRTVEGHRGNLMSKLNLRSRVELTSYAEEHGLLE